MSIPAKLTDAAMPSLSPEAGTGATHDLPAKTDIGAAPTLDDQRRVVAILAESAPILSYEKSQSRAATLLGDLRGHPRLGAIEGSRSGSIGPLWGGSAS